MEPMDLLAKLKELFGDDIDENVTDSVLVYYLDLAKQKILERLYPFDQSKTEIPERYQLKQVEIAHYLFLKRGAEGETVHNENGINRTYESADVPESLMKGITPYCGLPT